MKPNGLIAVAVAVAAAFVFPLGASAGEARQSSGQDTPKFSASAGAGASKQGAEGGPASAKAPVIVLFPVEVASSDKLGDGCWARLYDGGNFRGDQLALVGPVDMPNMRTAFGKDWGGEFDSIAVGPKATVTVYDNENYRDRAATFKPNQKVAEMSDKTGLFKDVRSLKIACADGARAAQQSGEQGSAAAGAT